MALTNPGRNGRSVPKTKASPYGMPATSATENPAVASSMSTIPEGLLEEVVDQVAMRGDLISFSRTSDGGAWCIYVRSSGEVFKWYPHTTTELRDLLQNVAQNLNPDTH